MRRLLTVAASCVAIAVTLAASSSSSSFAAAAVAAAPSSSPPPRGELVFVNEDPRGSGFFPSALTTEPRVLHTDVFMPEGVHLEGVRGLPVVVYAHGFDSSPDENAELLLALANATGAVVYAPRSPGDGFNFKERASDVTAVLRAVATQGEPAYLLGFSLGAAAVLRAVERLGADATLPRVRGVLAFSPPGNLLQFMDFTFAGDTAVTVIVGTNDRSTPISRIERFVTPPYGSLARIANFSFFIVPGATHTGWMKLPQGADPDAFDIDVCLKTEPESHCRGLAFDVERLENDYQQQLMLTLAKRVMEPRGASEPEGGAALRSCRDVASTAKSALELATDASATVSNNPCRPHADVPGFCFATHDAWFPEHECMTPCCRGRGTADAEGDDAADESTSNAWAGADVLAALLTQWGRTP